MYIVTAYIIKKMLSIFMAIKQYTFTATVNWLLSLVYFFAFQLYLILLAKINNRIKLIRVNCLISHACLKIDLRTTTSEIMLEYSNYLYNSWIKKHSMAFDNRSAGLKRFGPFGKTITTGILMFFLLFDQPDATKCNETFIFVEIEVYKIL